MRSALRAARLAVMGAIGAALFVAGCGEGETFFPTGHGGTTTNTGGGGTGTGATSTGGTTTQGGGGTSTGGTTQGGGGTSTGGTAGSGGTTSTSTGECSTDADCDAALGPAPCGSWACNVSSGMGTCAASSPGCTDADADGYGTGPNCACAGLDCDDADDTIGSTAATTCYSGPAGTLGVGTCESGTTTCTGGVWSPCSGEVIPSGEACNNQDDDCDGMVDDNLGMFSCGIGACKTTVPACTNGVTGQCKAGVPAVSDDAMCNGTVGNGVDDDCDGPIDEDCGCVYVNFASLAGNPDGTLLNPFASIQPAIDWAATHPMGPQTVCVAGGAACNLNHTYQTPANATITMVSGVSVLGSYESTAWTRCGAITTFIAPQTAPGVTFPPTVQKTTVLDGFRVDRFLAQTTSAVTVDGAQGAIVTNIVVNNTPAVTNSYGVNVINGGNATITKSRIEAGSGTSESIAVRVFGAKVAIQNNCALALDAAGRCPQGAATTQFSILGRTAGIGTTYAVLLQDAPGSSVETSTINRVDADVGGAIRIAGDGAGILIRGNNLNGFGGALHSHGIWMEDCNDAAPWVTDNTNIQANGDTQMTVVNAIRAIGQCHPVVDKNVQIVGGGEGASSNPIGVYCGINAMGAASKCVVLGNTAIRGSLFGFPPTAIGVRCDDGGCNRIADNALITGRGGSPDSIGVWLGSTGTLVENNLIRGGCSAKPTGVRAQDSYARLENNRIFGFDSADCSGGAAPMLLESYGMRVLVQPGNHDLDVHSNDIDGTGSPNSNACVSRGVAIDLAPGVVSAQHGTFRDNIIRAGVCPVSKVGLFEVAAGADPLIVQNNDFDPSTTPTALYVDEGIQNLTMESQINMLLDITAGANISANPMFVNYPMDIHLQAGSPCIGAGTPVGAPLKDFEGTLRDAFTPDIGADEF